MTRIIGILNYKGGTGKTTTVVNLAAGLALRGERVLCVDLDAQGSLATYMGVRYSHSLADLLAGQAELKDCIVPVRERFDLIASDRSLLQAEGQLWRLNNDQKARSLLAEKMGALDGYSFVILDYSPSISLIGQGALLYANEIIVPAAMNYLAMIGTRQVIETLKTVGRTPEHNVHLSMIVPTFYAAHLRKDREIMESLNQHFAGYVSDPIRVNVSLAEACSRRASIYEYAPRSAGAVDYAHLVEKVVANG
jgi:chromosome partitioning protein